MNALEALKSRLSINFFDTAKPLSKSEIEELVDYATLAPSACNMQHWRFIAVTTAQDKDKLKAASYGQQKVSDAAVTFIVLADLKANELLAETLRPSVDAGIVPKAVADSWVGMTAGLTAGTQAARDEAFRSASLAAMNLMIAATAKGLASGPMSGFEADKVKAAFGISERYVPVILVTVGHKDAKASHWARKVRLPVSRVLGFDQSHAFKNA